MEELSKNNQKKEEKKSIIDIFNLFYVRVYLVILFVLNLLSWLFVYFFFTKVSQSLIILHYNVDFGVDLIGDVKNIFIIPALGLFIIIFNLIISSLFLENKHFKFVTHLLLASATLVNLFLLLALGPIYLINFR